MKNIRIVLVVFLVLSAALLVIGCKGSNTPTTTTKTQTSTVQKGNIALTVVGTGNLAFAQVTDVVADMAGTIESVLPEVGQSVVKGEKLAKFDTTKWEEQIATQEKAVTSAQKTITTLQNNLSKTERQVSSKEMSVRQAELDLESAGNNLAQISEVKKYQDLVEKAEYDLQFARSQITAAALEAEPGAKISLWDIQINYYKEVLAQAQANLKSVLSGTNTSLSTNVVLQVTKAQFQIEQSQKALDDAKLAVQDALAAVNSAKQDIEDAETALQEALDNLNETKNLSLVINAPATGIITKVNIKGGDNIQKGSIAFLIADPNKFEANILITEQDIFSVILGGDATVAIDALSDLSFPAKITQVAPAATIQQGVVNYKVTVELTSLIPVMDATTAGQRFPQTGLGSQGSAFNTNLPGLTPGATIIQGNFTPPPGFTPRESGTGIFGQRAPGSGAAAGSITLKDGLSASVTITIQQKQGVLLVPSRAITRKGLTSTVQIVKGTVTEQRTIKTGLSDGSNTEIIEGLSEGEQVVYTLTSTSTTNNTNRNAIIGGPGIRIP